MLKLGIRTRMARTPVDVAPPLALGANERPTLTAHEPEHGKAPRSEDWVVTGAAKPYRPRHAADATEEPTVQSEAPADLATGRHRG